MTLRAIQAHEETMCRIGFVQFCPARFDVRHNIAAIEQLLDGIEADLVVLPELANSGYMYETATDLAPFSEAGDGSGPFLSTLQRLAAGINGLIVTGFAERTPAGLYNSAAAVDASGLLQIYRKTHLFADEKSLFLPGDTGFRVLEHRGVRIGMMVCFDWFFPESVRTLALRGAQVIAHPANLVLPYCQTAMVTRCLENHVFAVTANRYGAEMLGEARLGFTGASQILDTLGRRLAAAPADGEAVSIVEIDPGRAKDKRVGTRNHLLADRRPEFYEP